jgi:hypothetical protein
MSASRLQRRACAPEPRGRGRSAVPKRTNSSTAFSCTSLDAALHACGATSFPSPSSSTSPSPPTSPEEEKEDLNLPPASSEESKQATRDHTTPYPYTQPRGKDPRLARVAEPSVSQLLLVPS